MKNQQRDEIHRILDGEELEDEIAPEREKELAEYQRAIAALEQLEVVPPDGFVSRVMNALPQSPQRSLGGRIVALWPHNRQWLVPALAGAMGTLLLIAGASLLFPDGSRDQILVTFELHAPQAESVELIGSFNHWARHTVSLHGPDASGHWTVTIPLPSGRYEYQFLVDDKELVTDPKALLYRPDGFGRENAVVDI